MRRLLNFAFPFLLLLPSTAGAAPSPRIFTEALQLPGVLPDEPSEVQQGLMGLMLLAARDTLAGTDTLAPEPWPCAEDDTLGAFMTPNSIRAYETLKVTLRGQGWSLVQEVRTDDVTPQFTFLFRKGEMHLMDRWAQAGMGARSTLVACQRVEDWRPAPVGAPLVTAPRLALPFRVTVEDFSGSARTVRATARGAQDQLVLVGRGQVGAAKELTLHLPAQPAASALRPASEWLDVFGMDGRRADPDVHGRNAQVGLLVVDAVTMLQSLLPRTATDAQLLGAVAEPGRVLWNGSFMGGNGLRRLRLVYSSAPLTLRGNVTCARGVVRSGVVNVTLPGGWTAVVEESRLPDRGEATWALRNPTGDETHANWREGP